MEETIKEESRVQSFFIFFIFIVLTLDSSLFNSLHAAAVDDVVNDVQKRLSSIHDLKGSFTQTSYLKDLEKTETYAGTFYIKKPSGIMWEYKSPRDEKVFIKGEDMWIYKRSQKQAIKSRFSKEAYSQAPITLLSGLENLRSDFDITLTDRDTLDLKPKRRMGSMQEVIIRTASKNFPLKTLKVIDTYGNVITIELADIKTNTGPEDSLFTFTVPQGVEVFDMDR
ncbi:MAG: outer membrane lipoprotein chaperone LolA [Nitrospirae bacterium]|nr:outer membrane lipoprotein chaperone LolA [Nitrospirota bacterium]